MATHPGGWILLACKSPANRIFVPCPGISREAILPPVPPTCEEGNGYTGTECQDVMVSRCPVFLATPVDSVIVVSSRKTTRKSAQALPALHGCAGPHGGPVANRHACTGRWQPCQPAALRMWKQRVIQSCGQVQPHHRFFSTLPCSHACSRCPPDRASLLRGLAVA